jgi:molybdenum cofactor biosynthesis enzyme MoaA
MAENTPQLSTPQIIALQRAFFDVFGDRLRCLAITGGEPLTIGEQNLLEVCRNVEGNVDWWFLNTNASLATPKLARELKAIGLKEVKINAPIMDPSKYRSVMGREMLERQKAGILSFIQVGGVHVDINVPLMKGINDSPKDIVPYAQFFQEQRYPGQVLLKIFPLEKARYGTHNDELFHKAHKTSPQALIEGLGAKLTGVQDFGRKSLYEVIINDTKMNLAVITERTSQELTSHPTRETAFVVTHSGRMKRISGDTPIYAFDFNSNKPLTTQVEEALKFFECNQDPSSSFEDQEGSFIDSLTERLHTEWQKSRRITDTTSESKMVATLDFNWIRVHEGRTMVDVANTAFEDLPPDIQQIYQSFSKEVARVVMNAVKEGRDLNEQFIVEASAQIYEMGLNNSVLTNVESAQDQIVHNREIVKTAIDLYQNSRK